MHRNNICTSAKTVTVLLMIIVIIAKSGFLFMRCVKCADRALLTIGFWLWALNSIGYRWNSNNRFAHEHYFVLHMPHTNHMPACFWYDFEFIRKVVSSQCLCWSWLMHLPIDFVCSSWFSRSSWFAMLFCVYCSALPLRILIWKTEVHSNIVVVVVVYHHHFLSFILSFSLPSFYINLTLLDFVSILFLVHTANWYKTVFAQSVIVWIICFFNSVFFLLLLCLFLSLVCFVRIFLSCSFGVFYNREPRQKWTHRKRAERANSSKHNMFIWCVHVMIACVYLYLIVIVVAVDAPSMFAWLMCLWSFAHYNLAAQLSVIYLIWLS